MARKQRELAQFFFPRHCRCALFFTSRHRDMHHLFGQRQWRSGAVVQVPSTVYNALIMMHTTVQLILVYFHSQALVRYACSAKCFISLKTATVTDATKHKLKPFSMRVMQSSRLTFFWTVPANDKNENEHEAQSRRSYSDIFSDVVIISLARWLGWVSLQLN